MIQTQKVIKVGNSLAMTFDSKVMALMNVKAGQELAVAYHPDMGLISVAKTKKSLNTRDSLELGKQAVLAGKITPELKQWTDKFLVENQEAMKKLADL